MLDRNRRTDALTLLGELLAERGEAFHLAVIGGAAMLLHQVARAATVDVDAVAQHHGGRWRASRPLPAALVAAVEDVQRTLDLHTDKAWLNDGPSVLFEVVGLPDGWEARAETHRFGGLTLVVLARSDLIFLKVWAATDARSPERRARDIADLRVLVPTPEEWEAAVLWCASKDGTPDFLTLSEVVAVRRAVLEER